MKFLTVIPTEGRNLGQCDYLKAAKHHKRFDPNRFAPFGMTVKDFHFYNKIILSQIAS